MKTVFTLLMLLVIWFAAPAQTLEGFFGFRFGSSTQLVRQGLAAKPGCIIDEKVSSPDKIVIGKTPFAGREARLIMMHFFNDQLYKGAVLIEPLTEGATIDTYEQIVSELNARYYKTDEVSERFQYPYERSDGRALYALKDGKADLTTTWRFKDDNMIRIFISPRLDIILVYYDGPRYNKARKIISEQNGKDY